MTRTLAFALFRGAFRNIQLNPGKFLSVARQRRDLAQLDGHQLLDINVTRGEADAEANRSFWDAPETWRR
ncbi:MAG: DUF1127 domain-containing protein [Litoreibacter sp.]